MIPSTQRFRTRMAAAVFFGTLLDGCEAQHLTRRTFKNPSQLMAEAVGGIYQKGPRAVTLLHFKDGAFHLEIARFKRVVSAWVR